MNSSVGLSFFVGGSRGPGLCARAAGGLYGALVLVEICCGWWFWVTARAAS